MLTEFVSPGFFDLFRFQRLQGRDVSWDDGLGKPAVALVSASLARALFPAGDAVGRHIRIAGPQRRDVEIIGVVADAPYGKLDDPTSARRLPADHAGNRTDAVSDGLCPGERRPCGGARRIYARREVAGAPFAARVHDVVRMGQRCAAAGTFTAGLATFAAALTVLLACMGVYGLIAFSVTARVREIGVRVALGASAGTSSG